MESTSSRARRAALVVALVGLLAFGCLQEARTPPSAAHASDAVERGRYLVTVLACNDCHTPFALGPAGPAPDMTRMLSGHPQGLEMPPSPSLPPGPWLWIGAATNTAFAGPWGVSYASNLTPHETTGLAIWDEEMFIRAMGTGRHMGQSRPILPPMPWSSYGQLTDEDMAAVFAYLRTVPAIDNLVPDAVVAEPPEP